VAMPVLEIRDLRRSFRGTPTVQALRGVSFRVAAGEVVAVLGANGAGKTTLVKIISTLLLPSSGEVRVCGADVVGNPRTVRQKISVIFGGDRGLYLRVSALDNAMFFGGLQGVHRDLRRRAHDALAQVGLADRARSRVETFSRGMRQRLHLAIGLMAEPELLLLDEPTIGLDLLEADRIREVVSTAARTGTAVVLTSHYPLDVECLAHRVVLLDAGCVAQDLAIDQFRRQAGFVAEVTISGTGAVPRVGPTDPFLDVSVEGDGSGVGWRLHGRVNEWSSDVLVDLAGLIGSCDVREVQVSSVGVEGVLRALLGERR
jgi:ABC-2 type transport system ATP-binding protein